MSLLLLIYLIYKYKLNYKEIIIYIILSIIIYLNYNNLNYLYISYLLYSSYVDYKIQIIPDTTHILSIIYIILNINTITINNILGSLIITIPFLIIYIIKKGIGLGDIKLVFFNGFILGIYKSIYMLNISIILIYIIIIIHKLINKPMNNTIAYGPYLMLSISILLFN